MSEKQRREGFRKAEASLRLEGMDPSGVPRYECLKTRIISGETSYEQGGNDSNLLIVFYVQIMPDDFVMQLHRF